LKTANDHYPTESIVQMQEEINMTCRCAAASW